MLNSSTIVFFLVCIVRKTYGQLYADDVSDGRCTLNPVAHNITGCFGELITPQVYTVNIGSEAFYRTYAESFLGRPAKDKAELDAMCYAFALIEVLVIQIGYGHKASIRSAIPTELDPTAPITTPFGLGKFKIQTTFAQSPGSIISNQFMTIDQIVWCDGKHFFLVRCVNGTRQDWEVASIGDPDPWVLPLVKKMVAEFGMPPENAIEYKSVENGGTCPVVPDLLTFKLRAAKAVGLPIPLSF